MRVHVWPISQFPITYAVYQLHNGRKYHTYWIYHYLKKVVVSVHVSEGIFAMLKFLMGLLFPISPFLNLSPKVGRREGLENLFPNFSIHQNHPSFPLLTADFQVPSPRDSNSAALGEQGQPAWWTAAPDESNASCQVENSTLRNFAVYLIALLLGFFLRSPEMKHILYNYRGLQNEK